MSGTDSSIKTKFGTLDFDSIFDQVSLDQVFLRSPAPIRLNLNKALTAEKKEEGQIPPYHWVIVTNHVQVKHMAFTKEFNIETLTNVKLHSNGSVLLTTSNADGSNRISFLSEGRALRTASKFRAHFNLQHHEPLLRRK